MQFELLLFVLTMLGSDPAAPAPLPTEPFEAPKYGLATRIPRDWTVAIHEQEDRIFVAVIPQKDLDRPGIAACELALAPESLDDYRTRIDSNAKRNGRPSGKLARNQISKGLRGDQLETVWEFHPDAGGFWREVSIRVIAHRQLYTFILNAEDSAYAQVRPAFDAIVAATSFTAPNTGADLLVKDANRWIQREYKFALDLPGGWAPRWLPARSHSFSPTDRRTVSGLTISWSWRIHTATPASPSWQNSFQTTCTVRIRRAR